MEMYFKEIGLTIRHMEMEIIIMLKEQLIKEVGMKISKKEKDEKNGQMDHIMKDNGNKTREMEMENFI
jgi:hypothetical protein